MRVYLILILYIVLSCTTSSFSKTLEMDKIVAVVNNKSILNSDINQVFFYLKQDTENIQIPFKKNFLRNKILDKLITDTLMLEEANKLNITISDNQIEDILKNIAIQQNITLNQLKKNIILYNTNDFFSYEDYIDNIKKSFTIKMLQDYIFSNIYIPSKKVNYLLNKNINQKNQFKINLKCIILPVLKKDNHQVIKKKKKLISNLFKDICHNSNFDMFYKDFQTRKNIFLSKSMSLHSLKNINNIFFNTMQINKKNQIFKPFLGQDGFYIIKIDNINSNNTEKKITEFYIQHCLIRPSIILSDAQSKKDIFKIYHDIKHKHYTFEYAVKYLSHDVYSVHKKGDLGWISNESYDSCFKNILNNLNNGEISKPIKSHFGWHILKLIKKRKINIEKKLEKEKIYQILLKRKIKKEKIHWIENLKQSSYIKIF